jgi:hypothetical protein
MAQSGHTLVHCKCPLLGAMRESAECIEDMLDEQFRRRFGELMYRTALARRRESLAA